MQRKLTKKLNTTIQHQEDEDAGASGNRRNPNNRRGNSQPPQQQPYEVEDELEEEPNNPLQRERPYGSGYDPSNPFTHYDARPQPTGSGRGSSSERIQNQEQPIRGGRTPTANSPRLGASILRQPSPLIQKDPPPQENRWQSPPQEEEQDDEEYETEEDGEEDEVEESNPRRTSHGRGGSSQKLDRKEKDVNLKKSGGSSGGQKAVKKSTQVVRKSSKAKDSTQSQPSGGEGSSRRSRNGSVASLNGNGSYISSNSSARLARNGSVSRHEIVPLPIEIPDTVTDVDTFRRYLSVRRGAVGPTTHAPFPRWEDPHSDSVVESLAGGGPIYGTSKNKHLNTPGGLAGAAAASLLVQRKSMALSHAIMTLALLSASASQLRFVVAYSNAHSYPALNYFLICSCIFVEILVGIGYVIISRFEFSERTLDKTNTYLIFGLFFVAIANVIIASFALDDHVCEVMAVLAKQKERERIEQFDTLDNSQTVLSPHQSLT